MSKSLADLRANPVVESRPERSLTVCLRPDLPARVSAITEQLAAIPTPELSVDDEERDGPPRKMAKSDEEVEIDRLVAELQEVLAEQAEHEGELRLRGIDDGDWRRWASKHPGRAKGEPGFERDREVTRGYCNADALMDDLARYAYAWNGEPFADGEFEKLILPNMSGGDKKEAAAAVVSMHETRLDFRQLRSRWSADLKRLSDSAQPEPSESPRPSSTDESSPSSTSTSTPPGD